MTLRRPSPRLAAALAAVLLLAAGAVLSGCAVGRGIEALHLLTDIAAGPVQPDTPLDGVVRLGITDAPALHGDLYLPTRGAGDATSPMPAAAALVLVPGLATTGKDDARLVGLAVALARARIAVLVPDIASLRELRAGPENIAEIADALRFLGGGGRGMWTTSEAEARPIGVAAISYAVGPALLATLEPDLAGRVGFLLGVGGYHDITASLTYITTAWYRDADGAWRRGAPNAYGKWAFVMANAARVDDPADRTSLAAMARRRLADLEAPIDDLVAGLGPEGSAVHMLVTNTDRARVGDLIAALPAPIRDDMAALDLAARDLSAAPPALLLHGRDDTIIPPSESVALAGALGETRAHLILLDSLAHADLGLDNLGDAYRMWRAAYWLLAARDGAL
jgi:fermentation-respiration switch protein FrsA (DUF1100 family)